MTKAGAFKDFLVEIGTEELPPLALEKLSCAFCDALVSALAEAELGHAPARVLNSPRRLAVYIPQLQTVQSDQTIEKRGPSVTAAFDAHGKPTRAAEGFSRSCGVSVDKLETLKTDKGQWLVYRGTEAGRKAAELLPGLVCLALDKLPIPRRMRWGDKDEAFVRPVHWVVMLLGKDVIPATVLGQKSGRITQGHRFMGTGELSIPEPQRYISLLRDKGYVLVDPKERRQRIEALISHAGEQSGGRPVVHDHVLREVCALVEWPVAVSGDFDRRFLKLPPEVLIATLEGHQRYFPLRHKNGRLQARFITISNIESRQPERVREGNERVVHPRLSDAEFFWQQDLQQPLEAHTRRLESVVFEKRLGSLADKSKRIRKLGGFMASELSADARAIDRAGELAKADLVTEMVGEFPELQGIMGSYYALEAGEDSAVSKAIAEQYLPRHAGDSLPATTEGSILALADRLDTLAGIFAIGRKPSGDKDPYALRRAAIGVLRILVEKQLPLDLHRLMAAALDCQPVKPAEGTLAALLDFMLERQRSWYLDRAIRHDVFDAVSARHPPSPLDFEQRLRAIQAFLQRPESPALTEANRRISNILRKQDTTPANQVDPGLLQEAEEKALHRQLEALRGQVEARLAQADYAGALVILAGLRKDIDRFFERVMVMAEDEGVRNNRLALLSQLREQFMRIADISRISG